MLKSDLARLAVRMVFSAVLSLGALALANPATAQSTCPQACGTQYAACLESCPKTGNNGGHGGVTPPTACASACEAAYATCLHGCGD
jgi:hypothetical protein